MRFLLIYEDKSIDLPDQTAYPHKTGENDPKQDVNNQPDHEASDVGFDGAGEFFHEVIIAQVDSGLWFYLENLTACILNHATTLRHTRRSLIDHVATK